MQNVGTDLFNILSSANRDLVDVFEFYAETETTLDPANAEKRFCSTTVQWNGNDYEQQVIGRGDVSRFFDSRFNSVNITLSNVDRSVATWLSGIEIEGYRVVVRCISRSVDDDSLVLFVGRCEKPFDVDNETVSISAKQDLGSIDNQLPWNVFSKKCPLEFKGTECLAGESLGSKSATYQAATTCNKSHAQCTEYSNTAAFQGIRFTTTKGNFKVSQRRGGAGGAILGLLGLGQKKVTKQYTSQDDSPYGKPVPLGFGRSQIEIVPITHADTGQYLAGISVIGEGELTEILNLRNVSPSFSDSFQALSTHRGKYGPTSEQAPAGFFTSAGDRYSHRGYVEYTILGTNPDTGDPAPTLVAVVLWIKIPTWTGAAFSGGPDWSDNPAEILRYILTETRSLNYSASWIDTTTWGEVADYCNEPLLDDTGGEDVYIANTVTGAGTDFKRYRSTGLLDPYWFRWKLAIDSAYPATREVTYNSFNPASPPSSITPSTVYRRRYTANFHLREKTRTADFLFKSLLPSFKGYLITGADGKLQLRSDRIQPTSFLRSTASAGATSLAIEDAVRWKALSIPIIYALVGAGESTSETAEVTSATYSTAGNSITLAKSTSGTITATVSGATLSGGSTTVRASGTVTIGGTPAAGNTVTVTIDGTSVVYTLTAADTTGTVAAMLATMINADETLNRFVSAEWVTGTPTIVTIKSKLGTLNLAAALASTHTTAEKVVHVALPVSDVAFGALERGNVLRNSFKWPGGSKQTSFNQFKLTYIDAVQDFLETTVEENDYSHQEKVNRVNSLEISGDCIDNYHQADRILQSARYKYREGDFFAAWATTAEALLLEEGDVVCANHDNMRGRRNVLLKLEEVKVTRDHRVAATGRLYSESQYPESGTPTTVALGTAVNWPSAAPGPITNLSLSLYSTDTIRGTFDFTEFVGSQQARIEIKRPGNVVYQDTGLRIDPDSNFEGAFEITGLPSGETCFRVTAFNGNGDGTAAEACYDTTVPVTLDVLEYQVMNRPEDELEVEVFS